MITLDIFKFVTFVALFTNTIVRPIEAIDDVLPNLEDNPTNGISELDPNVESPFPNANDDLRGEEDFLPRRVPRTIIQDFPMTSIGHSPPLVKQFIPDAILDNAGLRLLLRDQFQKYDAHIERINSKFQKLDQELAAANERCTKFDTDAKEKTQALSDDINEKIRKIYQHNDTIDKKTRLLRNYAVDTKTETHDNLKSVNTQLKELHERINEVEARIMGLVNNLKHLTTNPLTGPNGVNDNLHL